ncbi:MAG: PilZ domain-containing protein [bacterium]|nr:PilZ domain-containing protein [bacterium]
MWPKGWVGAACGRAPEEHTKQAETDRPYRNARGDVQRDLSATGLFVQTRVSLKPGQKVHVELREADDPEIAISAKVVRRYVVPSRLASISSSGVALGIENPSEAFLELVAGRTGATRAAPAAASGPVAAPAPAPAPVAHKASATWRVKASQIGKPRTRTLKLEALDEESACEAAKEELGDDWEILEATQD